MSQVEDYKMAVERGLVAMENLGLHYEKGCICPNQVPDYTESAKYYKMSADLGNISSMQAVARLYLNHGVGLKNDTEALEYIRKAAEKGHARALWNLGNLYECGALGIVNTIYETIDWKKARDYYRKAYQAGWGSEAFVRAGKLDNVILTEHLERECSLDDVGDCCL